MPEPQPTHEVPITEAARILGVSTDTIKRRVKRGQLKGQKLHTDKGEMWHIEIESDLVDDDDQAPTAVSNPDAVRAMELALEATNRTVEIMAKQLDARTRELHEAHVLLQQALGHQAQQIEALPERVQEVVAAEQEQHVGWIRRWWRALW